MSVILRPIGDTDPGIELVVTADEPWSEQAMAVMRGLGGGTQVVWSGQSPDAGQTVTHRPPAADVAAVLDRLRQPVRWELVGDGCPVLAGTGLVVERVDTAYVYGVTPAVAELQIRLVQA